MAVTRFGRSGESVEGDALYLTQGAHCMTNYGDSSSTISSAGSRSHSFESRWYDRSAPSTPTEFENNFPSRQKLRIHHDDSTSDGNMNLRVDVDGCTGRARQLTLFHLRMHDLRTRSFSLRRYGRASGREICHAGQRASTDPSQASLSHALRQLRLTKESQRPKTVTLQFSNYVQVNIRRRDSQARRRYEFEFWGTTYGWRRHVHRIGRREVTSFQLLNKTSAKSIAHITPDILTAAEAQEETNRGGWVPPSTLQITDRKTFHGLTNIAEYGSPPCRI